MKQPTKKGKKKHDDNGNDDNNGNNNNNNGNDDDDNEGKGDGGKGPKQTKRAVKVAKCVPATFLLYIHSNLLTGKRPSIE